MLYTNMYEQVGYFTGLVLLAVVEILKYLGIHKCAVKIGQVPAKEGYGHSGVTQ